MVKKQSSEYRTIHQWLAKKYSKADKCTCTTCTKKSKTFEWALKKGCEYAKNKDNFIQMCKSCHAKYDGVKPVRTIHDNYSKGEKFCKSKLKDIQVRVIKHILKEKWYGIRKVDIATFFDVKYTTIASIEYGQSWKHIKI